MGELKFTLTKWGDCPDCAAKEGELHHEQCDVTRCKGTGWQLLGCEGDHEGPHGPCVWRAYWPGEEFCAANDMVFNLAGKAFPDLNRLAVLHSRGEVEWDPESEDYVWNPSWS